MTRRSNLPGRMRTDRPFRAWLLSERRLDRLAGSGSSLESRVTEDEQERETEDGQLREIEA